MQAIGVLRQSYDSGGRTEGLALVGELVQLGKYGDVLTEGSVNDTVAISVTEDDVTYRWMFGGPVDANQLYFAAAPADLPNFLTSGHFQYLQADRIVPKTLYPQAPQRARDNGFLGSQGQYTADYLTLASQMPIRPKRRFPKSGVGLSPELLDKVVPTDCLLDQVNGWLQPLSPGIRLNSVGITGTDEVLLQYSYAGRLKEVTSNYYRPTNVGFGLTYSLPIVVARLAAQSGALLLLENPEAHLHPQAQTALGELLARCASDGVQIIVETHSDHLLNGVRLAVKKRLIALVKWYCIFFLVRLRREKPQFSPLQFKVTDASRTGPKVFLTMGQRC